MANTTPDFSAHAKSSIAKATRIVLATAGDETTVGPVVGNGAGRMHGIVKITATYTGTGVYKANVYVHAPADVTNTTVVSSTVSGFTGTWTDCIVLNLSEIAIGATTGKHWLATGEYHAGQFIQLQADGITAVYAIEAPFVARIMGLTQTTGSDGSASSSPSYAYTATLPSGDTITPTVRRTAGNGSFNAATYGLVSYDASGGWQVNPFEARNTNTCS